MASIWQYHRRVAADVAGAARQEDAHLIEAVIKKFIQTEQSSPLKPNIEITKFTLLNFVNPNNSQVFPSCLQKAYFDSKRLAWAIIF